MRQALMNGSAGAMDPADVKASALVPVGFVGAAGPSVLWARLTQTDPDGGRSVEQSTDKVGSAEALCKTALTRRRGEHSAARRRGAVHGELGADPVNSAASAARSHRSCRCRCRRRWPRYAAARSTRCPVPGVGSAPRKGSGGHGAGHGSTAAAAPTGRGAPLSASVRQCPPEEGSKAQGRGAGCLTPRRPLPYCPPAVVPCCRAPLPFWTVLAAVGNWRR